MDAQAPAGPPFNMNSLSRSDSGQDTTQRSAVPSIQSLLSPNLSLPPLSPPQRRPRSRISPTHAPSSQDFVDLTNDSDSSELIMQENPSSATPRRNNGEPVRKRRRVSGGEGGDASSSRIPLIDVDALDTFSPVSDPSASPSGDDDDIEEVDLSHVQSDFDLKKHQSEQRKRHLEMQEQQNQLLKDSVAAQQQENTGSASLSKLSCVICMESMTDMTATHCGHVFCHACIMEALIAGERQGHEPGKGLSRCPVCRKKVSRPNGKGKDLQQVIPLEIKFIRRSEKAKGKQREAPLEA